MSSETKQRSWGQRRSYFVDSKWQFSAATTVATTVACVVAFIHVVAIFALSRADTLETWSSHRIGLFAVLFSCLHLIVLLLALMAVMVRITHSVAGPARVIQQAVENLTAGKFNNRLTLRQGDYLKDLAAAVERLSQRLQQQQQDTPNVSAQAGPPRVVHPIDSERQEVSST